MGLNYNPKDASNAWDKGDYDATLVNVEEKTSKTSGNPMEQWTIEAYNAEGHKQTIKEYVVVPGATFKIKQLAEALDKGADFAAGRFQAEDHIGENFTVELSVEAQEGFPDKNRIGKFKAARGAAAPKTTTQAARERIENRPKPEQPYADAAVVFKDTEVPF